MADSAILFMKEIKKNLKNAVLKLQRQKIVSAILDAEILLAFVLQKPKEFLYTHSEYPLNKRQAKKFNQLIKKRSQYWPIAYLVGEKEFYGLKFKVNCHVLIPRPESELLIEEVKKIIDQCQINDLTLADVGTGSGCLAITLKKLFPALKIIATDQSSAALKIARHNAKLHRTKIKFYRTDLIKKICNQKIDLIIANLPYLKNNLRLKTPAEKSIRYEPAPALFAEKDGLDLFVKLFQQIQKKKIKPQCVVLEIGDCQGKKLLTLTKKYLSEYRGIVQKDWCGRERMLVLKK